MWMKPLWFEREAFRMAVKRNGDTMGAFVAIINWYRSQSWGRKLSHPNFQPVHHENFIDKGISRRCSFDVLVGLLWGKINLLYKRYQKIIAPLESFASNLKEMSFIAKGQHIFIYLPYIMNHVQCIVVLVFVRWNMKNLFFAFQKNFVVSTESPALFFSLNFTISWTLFFSGWWILIRIPALNPWGSRILDVCWGLGNLISSWSMRMIKSRILSR